jgi:hypothetical protein
MISLPWQSSSLRICERQQKSKLTDNRSALQSAGAGILDLKSLLGEPSPAHCDARAFGVISPFLGFDGCARAAIKNRKYRQRIRCPTTHALHQALIISVFSIV